MFRVVLQADLIKRAWRASSHIAREIRYVTVNKRHD